VLCRLDAYHGTTYLTASLSGKAGDRMPDFRYITEGIHHLTSPNFYRAPEGMDESAFCDYLVDEMEQKILQIGPENVAAFWAEPILGSGGVIVPPEDYNRRTWELCRRYDILYVADEVVTGFGRLGHWFASKDKFGVEPDIIARLVEDLYGGRRQAKTRFEIDVVDTRFGTFRLELQFSADVGDIRRVDGHIVG